MNTPLAINSDEILASHVITELKNKIDIVAFEKVNKGWSKVIKYRVETSDGRRLFLRISDINEYDQKKAECEKLEQATVLGIDAPIPVSFGLCNKGKNVYQLFTWCDGKDALSYLPYIKPKEQYSLGVKTGLTIQKLHTLPAPKNTESWGIWFRREMHKQIDFYNTHTEKSTEGDILVKYQLDNQNLLDGRPITFIHGDCNLSNIMITPDNEISLIDFSSDYGDPWWEFDSGSWGKEPIGPFVSGIFDGYFYGEPPEIFFKVFAFYGAYCALTALCAGISEGDEDGAKHPKMFLSWYENMQNLVPVWYIAQR